MKRVHLLLVVVLLSLLPCAMAQESLPWIVEYEIRDYTSGQTVLEWSYESGEVLENAPILAGEEYRVSFTLNVRQTVDQAVLTLSLSDVLALESEAVYWTVGPDFPRTEGFNPAEPSISLHHLQGVYQVTVVGKIKPDVTQVSGNGVTFHKPLEVDLVELEGPEGTRYDQIRVTVIDSKIDDYRFLLGQKRAQLEEYQATGVDPAYVELFQKFLALSEAQAELGLVDSAISLLETLDVEAPPLEVGPSWMEQYFLPVAGGLGVLAVLALALLLRTHGRLGFVHRTVEDQLRELEALQGRARRLDRELASRLEELSERLREAVRI